MLKLYSQFLKNYKGRVALVVIALFASTLATLLLPLLSKKIIDDGISGEKTDMIIGVGVVMLAAVLVGVAVNITGNYISSGVSMGFSRDLRKGIFLKISNLSQGDIEEIGAASLIGRETNDISQMQQALVQMLQVMLIAPIMCIGGIIAALMTAPSLAWIVAAIIPVTLVLIVFVMTKASPLFKLNQVKLDTVNRTIREALNGMRVIRAFNNEQRETDRFSEANFSLTDTAIKANKYIMSLMPAMMLLINGANILILCFGGHSMEDGTVSYGDVQAFIQYVSMILMSVMMCTMLLIIIPRAGASAARINEVLDKVPSIEDPESPAVVPEGTPAALSFKNVSFRYPGAEGNVLTDISFDAKAGETIAIIGGTGSGKTTLINLIPRFYDVTEGSVTVDGVDVRQLSQTDLRNRLSVVSQKSFLFSGTIAENVAYGKENATAEEISHALEVSQSMEFVSEKDYGIYSYITQSGSNVSGGQRQRLSIARALVRKPEIYIFDDSFSALDFKTDSRLRKALKKEIKSSILLIVAQRVGTIMDADRILVMENGRVVGSGTHKELLKTCEVYREIALSQLSESEVNGDA